jgi:uncharacterized protein YacL
MMESESFFRRLLSFFLALLGALFGYQLSLVLIPALPDAWAEIVNSGVHIPYKQAVISFVMILGGAFFGLLISPLLKKIVLFAVSVIEARVRESGWRDLVSAATGLTVGLIIANLLTLPFWVLPVGGYISLLVNLAFGIVGAKVFVARQRTRGEAFSLTRFLDALRQNPQSSEDSHASVERKLLDTSVAIDGRILDVARTGFLSGTLAVPQLVLHELQSIADSSDPTRRTRGRRGLDIIGALKKMTDFFDVKILPHTLKDLGVDSVDGALLMLAKELDACILTTDYNLAKLAQIQGILILNIHDLANSIRPILIPGDLLEIDVVRTGKEPNQGVGYLEDGTLFVVEDGEPWVGKRLEVVVTSMLQTSAGRMVFGRTRREIRDLRSKNGD